MKLWYVNLFVSDFERALAFYEDALGFTAATRDPEFVMAPEQQPWGGFMAMFRDPDGNTFYLDQLDDRHGSG